MMPNSGQFHTATKIVKAAEFRAQFDDAGVPKGPFSVYPATQLFTDHMRGITSLKGVTLMYNCRVYDSPDLLTVDGLVCRDNVTIYCRLVTTLTGAVFGDHCTVGDLGSVTSFADVVFGEGCQFLHMQDPVDFGTPKLTDDEMKIVRQINVDNCYMQSWHDEVEGCGTVHCLAGWAEAISDPGKRFSNDDCDETAAVGHRLLPGLSHLFYASNCTNSVREMIKRLQALPA